MNKKQTAGMAMGTVIIFIMVMSVTAVALLVASTNALRNAQRLPQGDGEFFSAEAAMNRAVPGIVTELVANTGAGSLVETVIDAISIESYERLTVPPLITSDFLSSSAPGPTTDTERQAEIRNRLLTDTAGFHDFVRGEVHDFVENALGSLPIRHDLNLAALRDGTADTTIGNPLFWLVDGTNVSEPTEAFGAPAFANLQRVDATDTVELGWPTVGDFVDGIRVVGPVSGWAGSTANQRRFEITVMPYITVNSYAGVTELTERVLVPFAPFYIEFEVNNEIESVFAGEQMATFNCLGFCHNDGASFSPHTFSDEFVAAYGGGSPFRSCGTNSNSTFCPANFSNPLSTLHQVRFNGTHPPDPIRIDPMNAYFGNYREGYWNNARPVSTGGTIPNALFMQIPSNVPTFTILGERIGANHFIRYGSAAGVATATPIPAPTHLFVSGGGQHTTLIGDFSGINVYVRNNASASFNIPNYTIAGENVNFSNVALTLGTETQPFVVDNTSDETSIFVSWANILVNVSDGFTANRVNIGTQTGDIRIRSFVAGDVVMNARFMAQNVRGFINASNWSGIPLFMATGQIRMRMLSGNSGADYVPMGAFFHSTGGDHLSVGIENGGARFDGYFFSNSSSGSIIRGNTNLAVPPNPPVLDMMPELVAALGIAESLVTGSVVNGGGGNNLNVSDINTFQP